MHGDDAEPGAVLGRAQDRLDHHGSAGRVEVDVGGRLDPADPDPLRRRTVQLDQPPGDVMGAEHGVADQHESGGS
ncbi:hypothetical protein Ato02nite_071540 [Paractinoplanes toevensis]|uniref:Uncharacterized protein n=1 Tax=Paractinoplanes toevensis TaxID=571911 RepID=A0A919W8S3_9ACTN|nr:hypothetical protein Ato02nite_071540 [Actinoplanes toevensis]